MHNKTLAEDYLTRATHRLAALDVLFERESWADVVRESQELVELALKSLLRHTSIEVPRVHDVGQILRSESERLPESIRPHIEELVAISRSLRRDRELAFYGSEDLTPSDFYQKTDAETARAGSRRVVEAVTNAVNH
jgi:HEPN domain-containing protein